MGLQGSGLGSFLSGSALLSLQPMQGRRRSTMKRGRVALGRAFFWGAGRDWALPAPSRMMHDEC